jgi:hypothetical protein
MIECPSVQLELVLWTLIRIRIRSHPTFFCQLQPDPDKWFQIRHLFEEETSEFWVKICRLGYLFFYTSRGLTDFTVYRSHFLSWIFVTALHQVSVPEWQVSQESQSPEEIKHYGIATDILIYKVCPVAKFSDLSYYLRNLSKQYFVTQIFFNQICSGLTRN